MKSKKKIRNLDFSSEKQAKQKKMRSFIIAFSSFVIILGTISVFIFMKSVDFNLNNLVQSTTVSDESTSDLTTASYALSGRVGILLVFTDDSGELISVSALDCNMTSSVFPWCNCRLKPQWVPTVLKPFIKRAVLPHLKSRLRIYRGSALLSILK